MVFLVEFTTTLEMPLVFFNVAPKYWTPMSLELHSEESNRFPPSHFPFHLDEIYYKLEN